MTHDVFISYSVKDKNTATTICHALEENGIRCWIAPRDQLAGVKYIVQITQAIRNCVVFVLIFSGNSNHSEDVISEVQTALDNEKIVIPFRIENTPMSDELRYMLKRVHWLDAYPDHQLFDNLIDHVQRNLDKSENGIAFEHHLIQTNKPEIAGASTTSPHHTGEQRLEPGKAYNGLLLSEMHLSEADLKEASFIKTVLMNSDMRGAHLVRADFTSSNLEGSNLSKADLRDARLTWSNLRRTILTEANLEWARLSRADLTDAVLDRATLTMADMRQITLVDASLKEAILVSALLSDADCRYADFSEADFRDAILEGARLEGANLRGAKNLSYEQLKSAIIDSTTILK